MDNFHSHDNTYTHIFFCLVVSHYMPLHHHQPSTIINHYEITIRSFNSIKVIHVRLSKVRKKSYHKTTSSSHLLTKVINGCWCPKIRVSPVIIHFPIISQPFRMTMPGSPRFGTSVPRATPTMTSATTPGEAKPWEDHGKMYRVVPQFVC